jgi:hypothetical protein
MHVPSSFPQTPFLEWSHAQGGMASVRKTFERLQGLPHGTGLELFKHMLKLEHAHLRTLVGPLGAGAGVGQSKVLRESIAQGQRRIAQLYEAVLGQHGASADDLWLDYVRFELDKNEIERARYVVGGWSLVGWWLIMILLSHVTDLPCCSTLYWRAVKALGAPDTFINKYNALRLHLAL